VGLSTCEAGNFMPLKYKFTSKGEIPAGHESFMSSAALFFSMQKASLKNPNLMRFGRTIWRS